MVPKCQLCGRRMHVADYLEVPDNDVTWYACYGDFLQIRNGWFMCPECNDWTHEPSVRMFEERARHKSA